MNSPAAANRPLSRSALLIHVLGVALPAVCGMIVWLAKFHGKEGDAAVGMLLSLGAVFWLWSITLAARALGRGEGFNVLLEIMAALILIELNLPVAADWVRFFGYGRLQFDSWSGQFGIPVFLPVFTFAGVCGVLATRAATRKTPNEKRRRARIAWFASTFAALAVLLLPWPLFLYCACVDKKGAAAAVAAGMPDFVRDNVDRALTAIPGERSVNAQRTLLYHGRISARRYEERLPLDPQLEDAWFDGFWRNHTAAAMDFAERVGAGQTNVVSGLAILSHGHAFGVAASAARIQTVLDNADKYNTNFISGLVYVASGGQRALTVELSGSLQKLAEKPSIYQASLVYSLAQHDSAENTERFWKKKLAGRDEKSAILAAYSIGDIESAKVRYKMFVLGMEHANPGVRQATAVGMLDCDWRRVAIWQPELMIGFTQRMIAMLDSPDPILFRAAVQSLDEMVFGDSNFRMELAYRFDHRDGLSVIQNAELIPLTVEELKLKDICEARAREWLAKYKSANGR